MQRLLEGAGAVVRRLRVNPTVEVDPADGGGACFSSASAQTLPNVAAPFLGESLDRGAGERIGSGEEV
ncbi:MAG TPA: hypothetical protein VHR46_02090 [Gaiella sp.]|nr:hypothetical protein [Gaiella sp.]